MEYRTSTKPLDQLEIIDDGNACLRTTNVA